MPIKSLKGPNKGYSYQMSRIRKVAHTRVNPSVRALILIIPSHLYPLFSSYYIIDQVENSYDYNASWLILQHPVVKLSMALDIEFPVNNLC